jgi:hypothetical protein
MLNEIIHSLSPGSELLSEHSGGNSQVFCVQDPVHGRLAVKRYLGDPAEQLLKLTREAESLRFLNSFYVKNIPTLVATLPDKSLNISTWSSGRKPSCDTHSIVAIAEQVISMGTPAITQHTPFRAVDSIYTLRDLVFQFEERLTDLKGFGDHPGLLDYIKKFREISEVIISGLKEDPFPNLIVPSLSDLGVHNLLRENEQYSFIDFEYFGLDSISKLVADFFLHPQNDFSDQDNLFFLNQMEEHFHCELQSKLCSAFALLSMKWSLITAKRAFRAANSSDSSPRSPFNDSKPSHFIKKAISFHEGMTLVELISTARE